MLESKRIESIHEECLSLPSGILPGVYGGLRGARGASKKLHAEGS